MTGKSSEFIRVVVNTLAKSGLFDYAVPKELSGRIRRGQMVTVPFNHSIHQGIVWKTDIRPEAGTSRIRSRS